MSVRKEYDRQLAQLNAELLHMGEMISHAISEATAALLGRNDKKAREIIAYDEEIDRQERTVEQLCYKLLLRQQPIASDLRLVSAALKMVTDMERIGDHAADLSEIELMMSALEPLPCNHLQSMAAQTRVMLMKSIESFAQRDMVKAGEVIVQDDVVDALFDAVRQDLISAIGKDPSCGGQATDLLMAAKYFERIGDHAVNIAQWSVFSMTGNRPADK